MWSGPRTVSTAMMRAWENRPDTVVFDEPLYAFYLASTGLDHPGRDEVVASQPTSWQAVLSSLADDPLPPGAAIGYAKHMTHHVLASVDLAAFAPFLHAFLIRDPRSLLASYARVRSAPTLSDLGLRQQVELFEDIYAGLRAEELRHADWRQGMDAATRMLLNAVAERKMEYGEFTFSV